MYKYSGNGQQLLVDNYLASALLESFKISGLPPMGLQQSISYLENVKNPGISKIKNRLEEQVKNLPFSFPLIDSLLKIGQINFFVNTTVYSNILQQRIAACMGKEPVVIDFSLSSIIPDCNEVVRKLTTPHIFNVLGSFDSPDPALHEEEILEFTTSFTERMRAFAPKILDALTNKTLLFLGCTHPEWLVRFFLRVLSNKRMQAWESGPGKIIVVNDVSEDRQKQIGFFQNYKAITYAGNTDEFVNEMVGNFLEEKPEAVPKKQIFISYNQGDVPAVEKLKTALESLPFVSCWYDKERLNSGDLYKNNIIDNIEKADIFLPVISANSLNEDKYVTYEWAQADTLGIAKKLSGKKFLLMPVRIDGADLNHALVKKYYGNYTIETLPDGEATTKFLNNVKEELGK